ncbi:MAG: DNA alkylation repair protein [Patescibacteria group bacterium]
MTVKQIIGELKRQGKKANIIGMKRFGIRPNDRLLGASMPIIRKLGKKIGRNHELALELWQSGLHEARILASIIEDPEAVTSQQADIWVADLKSWDTCDQLCGNLLDKTKLVEKKIFKWTKNKQEFIRRAGFVVLAWSAVHNKKLPNKEFEKYFSLFKKYSTDERVYVKKAISWAMREIGKRRSRVMHRRILVLAEELKKKSSKSARWIASDVTRELSKPENLRFNKPIRV